MDYKIGDKVVVYNNNYSVFAPSFLYGEITVASSNNILVRFKTTLINYELNVDKVDLVVVKNKKEALKEVFNQKLKILKSELSQFAENIEATPEDVDDLLNTYKILGLKL